MSCITTEYQNMKSIALDCSDKPVGGLKSLKFATLKDIQGAITENGLAVTSAMTKDISFNTKDGATNFTEVMTNQPNGSQSIVPTVVTQLNGINKTTRDSLELLSNPNVRLVLLAQAANGQWWAFGHRYGMICSEITSGTGANNSDFNGYNVTFTGEEDDFAMACTVA